MTAASQVIKIVDRAQVRAALQQSAATLQRRDGSALVYKTAAGVWMKVEPVGGDRFRVLLTKEHCNC